MLTRLVSALSIVIICFILTSCASITNALFGDSVDVNTSDISPPSIRISIPDVYVLDPHSGDFVVNNEDRSARISGNFTVIVIGEDPEGVRFVELLDISIEPTCAATPVGRNGRPPAPPIFLMAPATVIPGQRAETSASSSVATTRIPVIKSINLGRLFRASRWCPEDRPLLGNAVVKLRARAGNFGGNVIETAIATLSLRSLSQGGIIVGGASSGSGPSSGSGSSCAGAGEVCMIHPSECFGRGEDWQVSGTIQCRGGDPVCLAEAGSDYCTTCGGGCGGCAGHSCSESSPCGPGSICTREPRLGGSIQICRSIIIPETSTGNRPCTPVGGFCWQPSEAGQATLACSEAR